jgi:hypothetical protein
MRAILFLLAPLALFAQAKDSAWAAVQSLAGEWTGQGAGEPGNGTGGFSFTPELQGKILVRRNRASYANSFHEDLMIIHQDAGKVRATYFDSEGHLIQYVVSTAGPRIAFVSDPSASAPRYRFIYDRVDPSQVKIKFEIAPPGRPDEFKTYIEAAARRK